MISIINFFSISMIAFIGADRFNLLTNSFDYFVLTPFIGFSCLFIFSSLCLRADKFNFNWIFFDDIAIKVFSIYLITAIISIFFSIDIYLSLRRFLLLFYLIFSFLLFFSFYGKKSIIEIILK